MKVMFVAGEQFLRRAWQSYLTAEDEVVVVGRQTQWLQTGPDAVDGPRESFLAVPALDSLVSLLLARREVKKQLTEALKGMDALIVEVSETGFLAAEIADRLNKPWFVQVNACPYYSLRNEGKWSDNIYALYLMQQTKKTVRRAPYVVYSTKYYLQSRYPSEGRATVCANINIPAVSMEVLGERIKRIEKLERRLNIGLVASADNDFEGIETAIRALGAARPHLPNFEFRILADSDNRKLEELVNEQKLKDVTVFCRGDGDNEWLNETDIFIQPCYYQGLPQTMLYAMSRGCPVLGSNAGCVPEMVEYDCIYRVGDKEMLAAMLINAATSKEWQARQAQRNFYEARQYTGLTLDTIRERFWREFSDNVKSRHTGDAFRS